MINKKQIDRSANKIRKNIYQYPIILAVITLISISIIIFNSIEHFKKQQTLELKEKLVINEKIYTKNQLLQVTQRIERIKKKTEEELNQVIKSRIYEANNIIKNIIKENPNKSKEEIKRLASIALAPIRFFEGRGYYLVYDKDTKKSIIHPVKKFIGKDMSKFKDKKGQVLVDLFDKTIKNTGEGYADIYFVKPKSNDNKEYKKTVFVKSIPELNWVIGTGDYIDDVEKKIKKEALKNIETIRFGKNGYFWIHDTNHKLLMHPFRKAQIGNDESNVQDSKGNKFIQSFIQKAKLNNEGSFVNYYWYKPNSEEFYEKTSFVKLIEDWNWVIGAGVYIEDINQLITLEEKNYNNEIKKLYTKMALLFLVILIIVLFLSVKLSKNIKKEFNKYSDELTQLNSNLKKEVDNRTKELNHLNANLEEKIKIESEKSRYQELQLLEQSKFVQMGEMIGNIAHQWRQPLNLISSIGSGLKIKSEIKDLKKEELVEDLDVILRTTNHLSETIDHFREFIREKRELKYIIIQDRIKEVLNIVDTSMKNYHIEIQTELNEEEPISLEIVLGELSQVLINLLHNSKDALTSSDIENKFIKITCKRVKDNAIINVEDNAGGIKENILPRIFEPYFTTKHQSQGTGIGLYMSKNIIEKHLRGKLLVENTKLGAKFTIEIPLDSKT